MQNQEPLRVPLLLTQWVEQQVHLTIHVVLNLMSDLDRKNLLPLMTPRLEVPQAIRERQLGKRRRHKPPQGRQSLTRSCEVTRGETLTGGALQLQDQPQ